MLQCDVRPARSNVLQASLVFTTILAIDVFISVCVFVHVFVFVRGAGHVAMSYKPLYDHIGHTQRPHKPAFLSQTSLHSPFFNWP